MKWVNYINHNDFISSHFKGIVVLSQIKREEAEPVYVQVIDQGFKTIFGSTVSLRPGFTIWEGGKENNQRGKNKRSEMG